MKVADDGSVKVDVVKVADDAWHEARPLGTTAWYVRNAINFDRPEIGFACNEVRCYFPNHPQRLLTAETQVTLTLSQPSPTAKSLTPHRTRHTSGHVSAQRTPDTRALPAPGLRRADSGADHFASCLAFSHAMRFTLSRLSLSTARAARYQLSHALAHSRMRLVVYSTHAYRVAVQLHTLYAFVSRHYSGISNVCTHFMFVSHHYSYLKCTC